MKEKNEPTAAQLAYEYAMVDKKLALANEHLEKLSAEKIRAAINLEKLSAEKIRAAINKARAM